MNKQPLKIEQPVICPLHKCNLMEGKISILYNPPELSDKYLAARSKTFACSNLIACDELEPSTVHRKNDQTGRVTEKPVQYCKVCRKIEEKWLKDNSLFASSVIEKRNKKG